MSIGEILLGNSFDCTPTYIINITVSQNPTTHTDTLSHTYKKKEKVWWRDREGQKKSE